MRELRESTKKNGFDIAITSIENVFRAAKLGDTIYIEGIGNIDVDYDEQARDEIIQAVGFGPHGVRRVMDLLSKVRVVIEEVPQEIFAGTMTTKTMVDRHSNLKAEFPSITGGLEKAMTVQQAVTVLTKVYDGFEYQQGQYILRLRVVSSTVDIQSEAIDLLKTEQKVTNDFHSGRELVDIVQREGRFYENEMMLMLTAIYGIGYPGFYRFCSKLMLEGSRSSAAIQELHRKHGNDTYAFIKDFTPVFIEHANIKNGSEQLNAFIALARQVFDME